MKATFDFIFGIPDANGDGEEAGARLKEFQGSGQGTTYATCAQQTGTLGKIQRFGSASTSFRIRSFCHKNKLIIFFISSLSSTFSFFDGIDKKYKPV